VRIVYDWCRRELTQARLNRICQHLGYSVTADAIANVEAINTKYARIELDDTVRSFGLASPGQSGFISPDDFCFLDSSFTWDSTCFD
jgi:hypothetical protein